MSVSSRGAEAAVCCLRIRIRANGVLSGKCVRYFDVMLNLYRLQALVRGLHMANLAGTGVLDTVRSLFEHTRGIYAQIPS